MERYKEITTIKTINKETGKEEIKETERNYTIKTWEELTTEEKEQEIDQHKESIYECYQNDLYEEFLITLDDIKERYNNIDFDTVYIDSNSQGAWIDSVKNFKCYYNIDIFGETIEVVDIDLHIRKYIEEITENNINIYDYYLTLEEEKKIKNTKKYKNFINEIIKDVNNWINEINEACAVLIKNEYNYPSLLNDPEEADYLNNYFYDSEFIYEEKEEK